MTKFKVLGAVCLAAALAAASPALARNFGGAAAHSGGAHFAGGGGGAHFAGGGGSAHFAGGGGGAHFASGGGGGGWRGGGFRRGGGGFGPGIAAGVIAGAALGGGYGYYGNSGYYGDSYAYDSGDNDAYYDSAPYGAYNNGYNANGFVCQPGTVFRGEDGRRHLCQ